MPFKYRILVDGNWVYCTDGVQLDTLVLRLLRNGEKLEEIEIELVEAQ